MQSLAPNGYPNASSMEKSWGSLLWGAAAFDAWWQPSTTFNTTLDASVASVFNDGQSGGAHRSCIALHVRHGDVCNMKYDGDYRHCIQLDEYLPILRRMSTLYSLPTIFVSTDDQKVISNLTALTASGTEPWSKVVFQTDLNRTAYGAEDGKKGYIENRVNEKDANGDYKIKKPILELLTDVEAGSRCSALIGTLDSHVSELLLLRMTATLGAAPPFYSLGGPYCSFTGDDGRGSKTKAGVALPDGLKYACRNLTYTGRLVNQQPLSLDECFASAGATR